MYLWDVIDFGNLDALVDIQEVIDAVLQLAEMYGLARDPAKDAAMMTLHYTPT